MITCELCGKEVKTAQGLRGHMTFAHGVTGGTEKQPVARLATELQVSELEERLELTEQQVEQLSTDGQSVPAHSHRCDVSSYDFNALRERVCGYSSVGYSSISLIEQIGKLEKLFEKIPGLEKFVAEYESILRDLKASVGRERAKQRIAPAECSRRETELHW